MTFRFLPSLSRGPRAALTAALVLALGPCGASAQLPAAFAAAGAPQEMDELIVEGRALDLLGEAQAASQGRVGAAELAARPFLRRGELLEVVPGVVITQHSGGGKANQYFLRGFNLDHGTDFSLSVDGMPVNMRTHGHGQGYADLNFLVPEFVRTVEYGKGPFFADVGDFSAAGAVRYTLVDSLAAPFVSLEAGENGYARVVAGGQATHAGGTIVFGGEATHDDGPWQREENFRRFNAFVRHTTTLGAGSASFTGLAYDARWDATDQIPLRAVESGLLDRFGTTDPTSGGTSRRASVSFAWDRDGAGSKTHVDAYAAHYRLNLYSNFTYLLDDPADGDQFNQRDRRWISGGSITHTEDHEIAGRPATTTVGLQGRGDFIGEVGLHRSRARQHLSTVRSDEINELSGAVFAQTRVTLAPKVRLDAGARFDAYDFDVDSDLAANSGNRSAAIVSPKLGLVFGPFEKSEFYVNAGYGFHSNDARGTTITVDPVSGDPAAPVNPLVRSRGAELGFRTALAPGLVSTIAVWGLELDSELVFVGDAGGTEPSGATRRYGVEFANFWRVNPWLAIDADLSLTHGRYRDGGTDDRIANSLSTVFTAGITAGGDQGFGGTLRLRYFGPQPLTEDNSVRAPSSVTFSARLGWRGPKWEFAVDVPNVLDRENNDIAYFYTSRLAGEPAEGVDDIHFHPAESRTIRVSATRRF